MLCNPLRCLIFILSIASLNASAQDTQYTLKGIIKDLTTAENITSATVRLRPLRTLDSISLTTTKDGVFQFQNIRPGSYSLIISKVGFEENLVPITISANTSLEIKLKKKTILLDEVNIVSTSPLVKREIDKIVYQVDADPERKFLSTFDMFRKVPFISMGGPAGITLKGESDFRILINGKPSTLFSKNIADVLKGIPASDIVSIEVMTVPSSKYDAEGVGGIINIIMVKKQVDQYNVRLGMRYSAPGGPSGNTSISFKKNKFTVNLSANISDQKRPNTSSSLLRYADNTAAPILSESGENTSKSSFQAGVLSSSYEIDSLHLLTLTLGLNHFNATSTADRLTQSNINQLQSSYRLGYTNQSITNGVDAALNYELKFRKHKNRLLTFSYNFARSADFLDGESQLLPIINVAGYNFNQYNGSGRNEHIAQVDFTSVEKKVKLEAGLKSIFRENFSDFYSNRQSSLNYTKLSNDFSYQQNVYSYYNTAAFKTNKIDYKLGFRIELTTLESSGISDNEIDRTYTNFIPFVALQHKLTKFSSLTLNYTNRIYRPNIWHLNPFRNTISVNSVSYGNPDLEPSISNILELNFNYAGKLSLDLGLNYAIARNKVEIINYFDQTLNIYNETFGNGGKSDKIGFDANLSFTIAKNISVNTNLSLYYLALSAQLIDGYYKTDRMNFNTFLSVSKRFSSNYRVSLTGSYNNGILLLQGSTPSLYNYSASISKDLLKNRMNISFSAANIFHKYRYLITEASTYNSFQIRENQSYLRKFDVGLSYRFGKAQIQVKRNTRNIKVEDQNN